MHKGVSLGEMCKCEKKREGEKESKDAFVCSEKVLSVCVNVCVCRNSLSCMYLGVCVSVSVCLGRWDDNTYR